MITTKPYKGITVEFDEERHIFKANGKNVLSVTAVTGVIDKSRPLIYWAVGLARDYLLDQIAKGVNIMPEQVIAAAQQHSVVKERAATIGDIVHDWAERWFFGETKPPKLPDDENSRNGVLAFLKWIDENKVRAIESESIVYSKKYDYAGILDLEAKVNNKLTIVDFKTAKSIYNEMRYQVAAYQNAREEMTGNKYADRMIIRFDKETGEFEVKELKDQKADFKAFLGALAIKRRERNC